MPPSSRHGRPLDRAQVERVVGAPAFARGVQHALRGEVLLPLGEQAGEVVRGSVIDRSRLYPVTARLTAHNGTGVTLEYGECGCASRLNCEHVAALVLSTVGPDQGRGREPAETTWERSLGSLFDIDRAGPVSRPQGTPLAIAISLVSEPVMTVPGRPAGPSGPKVIARLVRPGRGGWAAGGLSWANLDSLYHQSDYLESHVRLLQEIYALHRSRTRRSGFFVPGEDKTIDLATFGSRQLWPMLDEAESLGVEMVHSAKPHGPVERFGSARLCLDVTADDRAGALVISPVVRVEGADIDAVPVQFIGEEGHGVVFVERSERSRPLLSQRPRLARLAKAVPPQLQRMALQNDRLRIPAGERGRFAGEFYPRLRQMAEVISTDGAFTAPTVSAPTLVLRATYGAEHQLDLDWEWSYQVGDAQLRAPLTAGGQPAGFQNADAERTILDNLAGPLDRFGITLTPHASFTGIETMRVSTELLPLLRDQPGVAVDILGEPVNYREASDSLRIGLTTDAAPPDVGAALGGSGEAWDEDWDDDGFTASALGDAPGQTDWFDLGITLTVEGREVPFTDVFLALGRDQSHMLLADGAYFSLRKPELQSLRALIEEARGLQDYAGERLRISRFQAGLWAELTELGVVDRQAAAWQRQVQGLLDLGSAEPLEPPATLHAQLRPYQLEGFQWLAFLWESRLGGILADDMGLGKTLQSLAMICHAKQADEHIAPFLIIAPTSVVPNWATECARFAPGLKVVTISDTLARRGQHLAGVVAGADVVISSYTLFRLDFETYADVAWSGLILDEAQFAKNHQSKAYQCARRLPAPFKLAITGTPMENNLMELWSLLSITAPGLFPSPNRFRDRYARPIEKQLDEELLPRLRRRIRPLITRRTKEQVAADLPPKQEQILEVVLDPAHRKLYQTHLQRERQKILGLIDDMNRNRFTILRSLTLLRQLSLHAGLVDDDQRDVPSAKIDALLEQLTDVAEGGHRALVFSQFTSFLDLVRTRLEEAGMEYCYLDGSTQDRGSVLRDFKEGTAPVFLISLKAGGFGLNLTEADYCFLLDPWWNPATEAQAVDRTHRIGQTRNVMVYRLIAKDTIEEKVMALKARKAALFSSVMDDGNFFATKLDADDIRGLFT
ncbi:DEAD/DEAH box helicase [Pseudonocardia spinosispora]|uniref:DEAD/DEAH box helicase n=1 Tax=Pseudonocardia spinosispora TaxID=103441 RepID=UPI000490BD63|nr:DEAD/DEAH box helicase [Pseudonocardia spinosispora]